MSKRTFEEMSGTDMARLFRTKGECEDEVTLEFDDGKELYASSTFLKMTSPVFKTMLESDFSEKSTGLIYLIGKNYDDFLGFLHLLHPAGYNPITDKTVCTTLQLAHEYQVQSTIQCCKDFISSIVNRLSTNYGADSTTEVTVTGDDVELCLRLLEASNTYLSNEKTDEIITVMKRFKSYNFIYYGDGKLFTSLPDKVKADLLLARLQECEPRPIPYRPTRRWRRKYWY